MNKLPNADAYGKKISAIIFCDRPQVNGKQFLKYSFVDNTPKGLRLFESFAKRFPGAQYVNYYSRIDYKFIERHPL